MQGTFTAVLFAVGCLVSAAVAQESTQGQAASAGPANVPGWSLMTPEERTEHHNKMMSFTNYEECIAYAQEHHKLMEQRAKAQGTTLPATPRANMCERLKHDGGSK